MANLIPRKSDVTNWKMNLGLTDYSSFEDIVANIFLVQLVQGNLNAGTTLSIKTDLAKGQLSERFKAEDEHWDKVFYSFVRDNNTWEGHVVGISVPGTESMVLGLLRKSDGFLNCWLATTQSCQDDLSKVAKWLREIFPATAVKREIEHIPINFWSLSSKGPVRRPQKIKALDWDEIDKNYPETTRSKVDHLSKIHPPIDGGRLLLWHGPPGTGKTSAIRSFLYSILPWADASYIVDPENFFGNADYMLQVLLDQGDDISYFDDDDDEDADEDDFFVLQGKDRWRLLVVEDADEFLKSEAKERVGQALSRLLNLADGIIGQGLNFLVLITTNEHLDNVHKAVAREGRCLANINFPTFKRSEALSWLGTKDESALPTGSDEFSLAQLYDLSHSVSQIKNEALEKVHGVYL